MPALAVPNGSACGLGEQVGLLMEASPMAAIGQDFMYPPPVYVKNTFLTTPVPRDEMLDGFSPRQVCSCPASALQDTIYAASTDASSYVGGSPDSMRAVEEVLGPQSPCLAPQYYHNSWEPLPMGAMPVLGPLDFGASAYTCCTQPVAGPMVMGHVVAAPYPGPQTAPGVMAFEQTAPGVVAPVLLLSEALPSEQVGAPPAVPAPPQPGPAMPGEMPLGHTAAGALTELPSAGSMGHHLGQCKPCAFTAKGCITGKECRFCHLCDTGEHKRRKKEKLAARRASEKVQQPPGAELEWHTTQCW